MEALVEVDTELNEDELTLKEPPLPNTTEAVSAGVVLPTLEI